ncbi:hypothetical protein TNCT_9851 [Trichonephila clavata]|uniref:Uncharacterized protein n=1 Tax=Trichonephila clavata TaxID=2740835 RepID=A0A8X6H1R7_TRICU|nr:hypothetical protein TNCT_9851 [Trichonephila clavata]
MKRTPPHPTHLRTYLNTEDRVVVKIKHNELLPKPSIQPGISSMPTSYHHHHPLLLSGRPCTLEVNGSRNKDQRIATRCSNFPSQSQTTRK